MFMDYQDVMLEFHKDSSNPFGFGGYFTCADLISKGSSGYLSELEFMGLFHHKVEKDDLDNAELKLELDTIESQYQQCFQELARMKLEAIDAYRKRWIAKKNLAESFSYSWLLNRKQSINGLTESPRPSYISHDDAKEELKFIAYLKRFLKEEQNFNFDVHPVSESVCADEIFSDGYIMPRYLDRSKIESLCEAFNNFNTNSSVPSTSTPPTPISKLSSQADFLEKWRKFSRKILVKWFGFVRPISKRIASSRKSTAKVDELLRKVSEIQSCKSSTDTSFQGSPHRMLKYYSVVNWCGNDNNQRSSSSSTRRVKILRKVKNWSNIN
ncbi:hypothetical protein BC332_24941 [Capsicum chinense]|nr:hypothetical protein BC332_24941 [Capsicum chinense]